MQTAALSELQAMVIAAVAGVAVMYAQAKLFALLLGLQSSGNIRMDNAVGRQGRVYLTIPPGGTGKAEVSVQGRLRVFDAVSAGGEALATGALVRVSGVRGGDVLVVEKIA